MRSPSSKAGRAQIPRRGEAAEIVRYPEDLEWAAQCASGNEAAIGKLVEEWSGRLRDLLVRRGASQGLAEELVEDLWGDCFGVGPGCPGLLSKYAGRSLLTTWLATVLTHRWMDRARQSQRREIIGALATLDGNGAIPDDRESALTGLLRQALAAGFTGCDPESLVVLQLVHLHRVTQREVAAAWSVSEFIISRRLTKALRKIREETLRFLRQKDRFLNLEWQDVVELCASTDIQALMATGSGAIQLKVQDPGSRSSNKVWANRASGRRSSFSRGARLT